MYMYIHICMYTYADTIHVCTHSHVCTHAYTCTGAGRANDQLIKYWSLSKSEADFKGHSHTCVSVTYIAYNIVATGGVDGKVYLWADQRLVCILV
jgi:hypothetical protein